VKRVGTHKNAMRFTNAQCLIGGKLWWFARISDAELATTLATFEESDRCQSKQHLCVAREKTAAVLGHMSVCSLLADDTSPPGNSAASLAYIATNMILSRFRLYSSGTCCFIMLAMIKRALA